MATRAAIARREVARVVTDSGAASDTQLQKVLAKKSKAILALDPACVVELAMFDALVGTGSERRLMAVVEDMFPNSERDVDAAAVSQSLANLLRSEQFKYAPIASQNKVKVVQKWVQRVVGDLQPNMENAKDCELLLKVSTRFQYFLRRVKPAKPKNTVVFGAEALAIAYDAAKVKHEKGQASLEDATPLAVFRYLAWKQLQGKIDALISAIETACAGNRGPASASSGGAKSSSAASKARAKGGKNKTKDGGDAEAAVKKAMTLFGCA